MNPDRLICIDLEMCCWDDGRTPRTGEIIEIGIAAVDLKNKVITDRSQYYVIPEKDEISAFCTYLTGITRSRITKAGRPLADVVESMRKKYGWHGTYGAWGRDQHVLRKECDEKGISMPFYEFHNLSSMFMLINGSSKNRMSMKKAMAIKGLVFEGDQHSGADDAYNLARLALKFIRST
jgi:inhibitor of KinA sporulation pathway (predicted exonuclease)